MLYSDDLIVLSPYQEGRNMDEEEWDEKKKHDE